MIKLVKTNQNFRIFYVVLISILFINTLATSILAKAQVNIEMLDQDSTTNSQVDTDSEQTVVVNNASVEQLTSTANSQLDSELDPQIDTVTNATEILETIPSSMMTSPRTQAFLRKPFQGDYALGNIFDHSYPFPFEDTGGHQLSFWGEALYMGYDGHRGYDWKLPANTPILAAAEGMVEQAGVQRPFFCSLTGGYTKSQISVLLKHDRPEGLFYSYYTHLSGVQVSEGMRVNAGQMIAYSGNSGCSDSYHLHFEVLKGRVGKVTVDPYGWQAPYHDPWQQHVDGAESEVLWVEGYAPSLFRESKLSDSYTTQVPVFIRSVRYFGGIHAGDVEGEVVRLELSPSHTQPYNLTNFTLKNDRGLNYTFPEGAIIHPNQPIFVHTKAGQNTQTNYYMNQSQAVWSDRGDCARLIRPNGRSMFQFTYMKYSCN